MSKTRQIETTALLPVSGPETVSMHTSDGVRLDADVYRPEAPGEHPVLLMRLPYGRRIASTVIYAHPSWYAANGYIVAVQDVRGRGTSEGKFRVFADDMRDGGEAIAWAAGLPGSTGKVGMYGFSYQGHTQLLALAAGRPELRALCPGMATWDVYGDWAYEGGAFVFANNIYWGILLATEQARLAGDVEAFEALHAALNSLPLNSPAPCRPEVLEKYARYTHYGDWIANPTPGPYWESIGVGHALQGKSMDVPMLHFGGWYDYMLTGTLRIYREAAARSKATQRLVVGPWVHMPWGRRAGTADFGEDSPGGVDALQIAWFDRFLKDVDNGVDTAPPVRLLDLMAKQWRDFDSWPEPLRRSYFTASNGLAATTEAATLSAKPPSRTVVDTIVQDPLRPVPTMGGHRGGAEGMHERSEIDNRPDVLTYTTEPLTAPMTLAGDVELTLSVRTDQPCFDISAILSCVTLEGRAYNLTQSHRRIENHNGGPIRIGMRALCASLESGDSLRLTLAGSDFPAFAVNPGTGAAPGEARQFDNRVVTITVTSGGDTPTRIDLPVLTTKWTNPLGFSLASR